MTVKDLYRYAKDLGAENYEIVLGRGANSTSNEISRISYVDDDKREVEIETKY